MNKAEKKTLDFLVEAWNSFIELPILHPDDQTEFRHGIHALQRIIMVRDLYKDTV